MLSVFDSRDCPSTRGAAREQASAPGQHSSAKNLVLAEDTFEPHAPWEDGRVFSMELQATNSPGEINFEEYEPYDDEASQRVIADLQRSIAGLAWR